LVDPGRRSEDGRTALFKLCREVVVSQTELRLINDRTDRDNRGYRS
jgi:hypothetical protein